ncbi:hypothetical protein [Micromonospora sp. WMMD987]|nr:hypothetical protein [Micromonospora sp. WMMD987]WFE95212.1 hypothetical protein O7612_28575 [Micromonospora sp. WMMD987]
MLLVLGVSSRTVMGTLGWSNSMAVRHQHLTDPVRGDIAQNLNG